MRIVIFGGTGGTGRLVAEIAAEAGHEVRVAARNPGSFKADGSRVSVVACDVKKAADVEKALAGQDAVVSALGPRVSGDTICSEGTAAIVRAMEAGGPRRLIVVSAYGVGDSLAHSGFIFSKILFPLAFKVPYADKEKMEATVRATSLDWTIVRPPRLTDGPKTSYRVHETMHGSVMSKVSRRDVASFVVGELSENAWVRRVPIVEG